MASHGKVQLTPGQVRALGTAALQGIPLDLDSDVAQEWVGLSQEEWAEILRMGPQGVEPLIRAQQALYHSHLGFAPDFSNVSIPPSKPGFDRLLLFPISISLSQILDFYRDMKILVSYPSDLEESLCWNQRRSQSGSYAIWVRDVQEANEGTNHDKKDNWWRDQLTTETLIERLWHGLVFFLETGKHLDENGITVCTGFRANKDNAPDVYTGNGKVFIRWCTSGHTSEELAAREVVAVAA